VQLAGVALPFVFVGNTIDNALRGFERFDLSVPLVALTRLATALVQIVLVLLGFQIVSLVLAAVILQVVRAVIGIIVLRKSVLPELALIPRFSLEEFKAFVSFGVYVWLNSLIGTARNSGEILILVSILGPALLTLYVVPVRVLSQVHLFLTKAFAYLFPFATKLIQSGKTNEIYSVYSVATRYLCTLSGLAIPTLAVGCGPLLSTWLTPEVAEKMLPVFQLLALRYAVFPLSILTSNLLMAADKTRAMTIIMAVNTVTIVPISALAAWWYGVQGAAAAQLLVFLPILFNRYFVEKTLFGKARLDTVIVPVLIASVPLACLLLTVRIPVGYALLPTILISGACGLLCGAVCWFSSVRFLTSSHFSTLEAS
jgi:O-antigen/teichoic acid export membrane protein